MTAHEEQLRRLALHDEAFIESILAMNLKTILPDEACQLSPKTHALVRLAALGGHRPDHRRVQGDNQDELLGDRGSPFIPLG
jgi:hypothetical protein